MAATDIIHTRDIDGAMCGLITDDGSSYYSAGADRHPVSGINELNYEVEYDTDESYGEAQILDYYSKALKIVGSFKSDQRDMKLYAALSGGEFVEDANTKEMFIAEGARPPFFFLDAQFLYMGGEDQALAAGDYHFTGYKLKVEGMSDSFVRGYGEWECKFSGIFPRTIVNPTAAAPDQRKKLVSLFKNITGAVPLGTVIPTSA